MKPKPAISQLLLSGSHSSPALVMANLLPLIPVMLKRKRFVSRTRELLDREVEIEAPVRVLYERVMETVFVLSGDLKHDKTRSYYCFFQLEHPLTKIPPVDAICQQSLDSLLELPPIPDFVRIIQKLLTHTKVEVEISGQRLIGNQG